MCFTRQHDGGALYIYNALTSAGDLSLVYKFKDYNLGRVDAGHGLCRRVTVRHSFHLRQSFRMRKRYVTEQFPQHRNGGGREGGFYLIL